MNSVVFSILYFPDVPRFAFLLVAIVGGVDDLVRFLSIPWHARAT